ncbi:MAG TPA: hypothetical protein PLS42_08275, partial [Candidatus Competibacter denitrificans]|nr:hypothetical protein [Candidatus Competibacter denitrificans]
ISASAPEGEPSGDWLPGVYAGHPNRSYCAVALTEPFSVSHLPAWPPCARRHGAAGGFLRHR